MRRVGWICLAVAAACAGGESGRGQDTELGPVPETTGGTAGGTTEAPTSAGDSTSGVDPSATGPLTTDGSGGGVCGDGIVDADEECDEGPANADDAACTSACMNAVCGDGLVWDGREACDDGNDDDTDACTSACIPPGCDDGKVSGSESDVDCGGKCLGCPNGAACASGGDCQSNYCDADTCAPAPSCAALLDADPGLTDDVYTIDPNGGDFLDAVDVFCDMTTDGGGWTAIAANGDISVPETSDPTDCYPLVSGAPQAGCGDPSNIFEDFTLEGGQQAALSWRYLMAIAYGDMGYSEKLAFFAIDFGGAQPTADERFNGASYVPLGITTLYGPIACDGYNIVHYTRSGTYQPSGVASLKGTVFGHDSVVTMNNSARRTFGFTDTGDVPPGQNATGVDDYQDGWSCSDLWGPKEIRGQRMMVLVR